MKNNLTSLFGIITLLTSFLFIQNITKAQNLVINPLQTIALSGQQADGLTSGITYKTFGNLQVNQAGNSVFSATVQGSGLTINNDSGLWTSISDSRSLIAREGATPVGISGGTAGIQTYADFVIWSTHTIDAANRVVFYSFNGTNNSGAYPHIWTSQAATTSLVYGSTLPSPGIPGNPVGVIHLEAWATRNSPYGDWAFQSNIGGSNGTNAVIYTYRNNQLQPFARESDVAPGTGGMTFHMANNLYSTPFITVAGMNDRGNLLFSSELTPNVSIFTFGLDALFAERNGSVQSIAKFNTPTGEVDANGTKFMYSFSAGAINNNQQVAFSCLTQAVQGSNVVFTPYMSDRQIWKNLNGTNQLVAKNSSSAPAIAGATLSSLKLDEISDQGKIFFKGTAVGGGVTSTNNEAIWSELNGTYQLEFREGDIAPGTGTALFTNTLDIGDINSFGQFALTSNLSGNGVNSSNNFGIWADDQRNGIQLIARLGDLLQVQPGDFRTVSSLKFFGLNDVGDLSFRATFTDGTEGLFIHNLVTIPEPRSIATVLIATGFALYFFKRRQQRSSQASFL